VTAVRRPTKLDALERVEVTSRAQLRSWLARHHTRTDGIWLIHWKKATPAKYIGYDAIVEEALCQGWIDSLPRKLDDLRTMIHLSPRKPKSVWSKVNKQRVERLLATGSMRPAGLAVVERARADGSWSFLDEVEALVVPADLARELAANSAAREHFNGFTPGSRKLILTWINSARKEGTRAERIRRTVHLAAQGIKAFPPVGTTAKGAGRATTAPR
jgi:uncharacterized protein YdeI (YjbR/CyaY-like superfamily)